MKGLMRDAFAVAAKDAGLVSFVENITAGKWFQLGWEARGAETAGTLKALIDLRDVVINANRDGMCWGENFGEIMAALSSAHQIIDKSKAAE